MPNYSSNTDLPEETSIQKDELVFSVSEYLEYINISIKSLRGTVQGEIGKVDERGSAVYFTLCDKNEKAIINCFAWKSNIRSMGVSLQEGMEVKIEGYTEIYKPYGKLTFQAQYITPIGEGALKLAFEKLKKELKDEGYFDEARKRQLPQYIETIGLITSETGAAIKDFLTHLGNHGIKIYFYDVRVEGVKSTETIVKAIRWFNENAISADVLVITRGGGSLESLQAFNTLDIAKAIKGSRIPVMTAIGHERDITIADLVADVRASVPTHAGSMLSEPWIEAKEKVNIIERNIYSLFRNRCLEFERSLKTYQHSFISSYTRFLRQSNEIISRYQVSMMNCFKVMLKNIKQVENNFTYSYERFSQHLLSRKQTIGMYEKDIQHNSKRWYLNLVKRIDDYRQILILCDPHLKLKQGFSIVKNKSGKVIKSSKQVQIGDIIAVQLFEGNLDTKIEEIN